MQLRTYSAHPNPMNVFERKFIWSDEFVKLAVDAKQKIRIYSRIKDRARVMGNTGCRWGREEMIQRTVTWIMCVWTNLPNFLLR